MRSLLTRPQTAKRTIKSDENTDSFIPIIQKNKLVSLDCNCCGNSIFNSIEVQMQNHQSKSQTCAEYKFPGRKMTKGLLQKIQEMKGFTPKENQQFKAQINGNSLSPYNVLTDRFQKLQAYEEFIKMDSIYDNNNQNLKTAQSQGSLSLRQQQFQKTLKTKFLIKRQNSKQQDNNPSDNNTHQQDFAINKAIITMPNQQFINGNQSRPQTTERLLSQPVYNQIFKNQIITEKTQLFDNNDNTLHQYSDNYMIQDQQNQQSVKSSIYCQHQKQKQQFMIETGTNALNISNHTSTRNYNIQSSSQLKRPTSTNKGFIQQKQFNQDMEKHLQSSSFRNLQHFQIFKDIDTFLKQQRSRPNTASKIRIENKKIFFQQQPKRLHKRNFSKSRNNDNEDDQKNDYFTTRALQQAFQNQNQFSVKKLLQFGNKDQSLKYIEYAHSKTPRLQM